MGTNKKLALSVMAAVAIMEDKKKKREAKNAKSKNRKK